MIIPLMLNGPLMGNADVENLQRALINLSQATNRPAVNPGNVDGVVGDRTVSAVVSSMGLLTESLPTWLYLTLQAAFAAGSMTSKSKELIAQYAGPLTIAANTAAVKFKTAPMPGAMIPQHQGFFSPGWYTRPAGILLILAVAFVGWKLFLQKPSKAA